MGATSLGSSGDRIMVHATGGVLFGCRCWLGEGHKDSRRVKPLK